MSYDSFIIAIIYFAPINTYVNIYGILKSHSQEHKFKQLEMREACFVWLSSETYALTVIGKSSLWK